MFIVPLAGDKIEAEGDIAHTVLGYAAYKDQPAVYVESDGVQASVPFTEIQSVNGVAVKLLSGKVFESVGRVKRKLQLPQKDDKATIDGHGEIKVMTLKLAEHGKLSDGMLIVGKDFESGETITAPLAEIVRVERTNGTDDFNRRLLHTLYAEYLGSKR